MVNNFTLVEDVLYLMQNYPKVCLLVSIFGCFITRIIVIIRRRLLYVVGSDLTDTDESYVYGIMLMKLKLLGLKLLGGDLFVFISRQQADLGFEPDSNVTTRACLAMAKWYMKLAEQAGVADQVKVVISPNQEGVKNPMKGIAHKAALLNWLMNGDVSKRFVPDNSDLTKQEVADIAQYRMNQSELEDYFEQFDDFRLYALGSMEVMNYIPKSLHKYVRISAMQGGAKLGLPPINDPGLHRFNPFNISLGLGSLRWPGVVTNIYYDPDASEKVFKIAKTNSENSWLFCLLKFFRVFELFIYFKCFNRFKSSHIIKMMSVLPLFMGTEAAGSFSPEQLFHIAKALVQDGMHESAKCVESLAKQNKPAKIFDLELAAYQLELKNTLKLLQEYHPLKLVPSNLYMMYANENQKTVAATVVNDPNEVAEMKKVWHTYYSEFSDEERAKHFEEPLKVLALVEKNQVYL